MLILSKKLAGAAAIPKGEPSGSRSLRLRADQSRDSGVGALSRRPAISRRPTSNASCVDHLVSSPGTSRVGRLGASSGGVSRQPTSVCELCWSLRFSIKAPMLIFRKALIEINFLPPAGLSAANIRLSACHYSVPRAGEQKCRPLKPGLAALFRIESKPTKFSRNRFYSLTYRYLSL